MKRRGRKSAAQTPALAKERISGSSTNPAKSAASKKSGASIKFTKSILNTLSEKANEYNEKHPNNKVSVSTLKAVMRRGMGAFSTSHRPGMTRQGWGYARVNKFLLKRGGGKVKAAYVQDDDLMAKGGLTYHLGGDVPEWYEDGDENISGNISLSPENTMAKGGKIYGFESQRFVGTNDEGEEFGYVIMYFGTLENIIFNIVRQHSDLKTKLKFKKSPEWHNFLSELSKYDLKANDQIPYIGQIEVYPEFRGQGYASILMKEIIEGGIYHKEDFLLLTVGADRSEEKSLSNTQLKKFYSKYGFKLINAKKPFRNRMILDLRKYKTGETYHLGGDMSKHLAPNGRKSNLTHEQWHFVRTPEFKAWFGDWENDPKKYQLLDENAEPMVFWHSGGDWNELQNGGKRGIGFLMFSTTPRSLAYSQQNEKLITRPFFIKSDYIYIHPYEKRDIPTSYKWGNKKFPIWFINAYGGFIVVRQSNQIKLADGSNTTFDPENPDIRYENGGGISSPDIEFMKWYVDWYKSANKDVHVSISIPNEFSSPTKDGKGKIVILDVIEKKGYADAKKYMNEIFQKADELGVSIYLQPIPRTHNLKSEEHKKKITKDYLTKYYEKFGFKNTNGGFMVREPKMDSHGMMEKGGQIDQMIKDGIVELKMYDTTKEHSKLYGFDAQKPLYIHSLVVEKEHRMNGVGSRVMQYIIDYAERNGNDVIFGHITQKAEPSIDIIKSMLRKSGFKTIDGNNDFYKLMKEGGDLPVGKLAKGMSLSEVAAHHGLDESDLTAEFSMGIETEKEHTDDVEIAKAIALDHLYEDPAYYTKLKSIESMNDVETDYTHEDYIENQRQELKEILEADELRLSKYLLCQAKYELAKEKEKNSINPEDANAWHYISNLWKDGMKMFNTREFPQINNVENPKSFSEIYYAKGGLAYGNSHAKGGIPLHNKSTGTNLEIEGGEGVVNKRSMQMKEKMEFEGEKMSACEIISKINQKGGGVKFKCSDVADIIEKDGTYN